MEEPMLGLEGPSLEEKIGQAVPADKARIHVIAQDGFIFLSGEVKNPEVKMQIEAKAWDIQGIRSVINHIRVSDWEDESYRLLEERVRSCPFKGADLLAG